MDREKLERIIAICSTHGETTFVIRSDGNGKRCLKCRAEAVSRRRRKVKEMLIAEAGGACAICGYDRYAGALHFHHLDPSAKAFGLGTSGIGRSLEKSRSEAAKCVLLCANCHAEVEEGLVVL